MKLLNKIKENKGNNKGFSLVELIIVIAIMAILVGIVGTQVIPYLNRSREAKDQQILSAWVTAAYSSYTTNAGTLTGDSYTITITKGDATDGSLITTTNDSSNILKNTFMDLSGIKRLNDADFASKTYQDIEKVKFEITPTSGGNLVTTVVLDGSDVAIPEIPVNDLVVK